MKKFILNILILIGIAGIGVLAAWFVRNCVGKDVATPEETVRTFYSSLFDGKWAEAEDLCVPSEGMRNYCLKFRQCWENFHRTDSSLLSDAAKILSDSEMVLSGGQQGGKLFTALFTITTGSGASKTKKVELVKEEGEWLINRITAAE